MTNEEIAELTANDYVGKCHSCYPTVYDAVMTALQLKDTQMLSVMGIDKPKEGDSAMTNEEFKIEERSIRGMTDGEVAELIADNFVKYAHADFTTTFTAVLVAVNLKNKQLKEVCSNCESNLIAMGKRCAWRSIDNTYCWEK